MFSPSELEGEVDHSFFDSDCDDGTRDGGPKMEKGSKAEKESQQKEGPLPSKHSDSRGRDEHSPKKLIRNQVARTPSPSLTENTIDADSESSSRSSSSSSSSSSGRSNLHSPTLPRPNQPSSSATVRRTRVGSEGSRDVHDGCSEESKDTMTDVSPLSSPDISPLQLLDLHCSTEADEGSLQEQQQQEESAPSSGRSDMPQDEDSYHDVDECSLRLESQLWGKLPNSCPGGRSRKNYSFSNDEVLRIDRENQRLLRELSRHSLGLRPRSTARKTHLANKLPDTFLSHSAVNRQREQQRIERENLAFLKRLESVKATPGLKRSKQLEDYQRLMVTPRGRSTRKTHSGSRLASSALHSSRAVSCTSDSSKNTCTQDKN